MSDVGAASGRANRESGVRAVHTSLDPALSSPSEILDRRVPSPFRPPGAVSNPGPGLAACGGGSVPKGLGRRDHADKPVGVYLGETIDEKRPHDRSDQLPDEVGPYTRNHLVVG